MESLEDNEAITASGLRTYSIIHDLKNKAVFDPGATSTTATTTTSSAPTAKQQVGDRFNILMFELKAIVDIFSLPRYRHQVD